MNMQHTERTSVHMFVCFGEELHVNTVVSLGPTMLGVTEPVAAHPAEEWVRTLKADWPFAQSAIACITLSFHQLSLPSCGLSHRIVLPCPPPLHGSLHLHVSEEL